MSHHVFVYGSLLEGFGNHRLLRGSRLISTATTTPGYVMFSMGCFPGVARKCDGGAIRGELYEVDVETRARLDRLEGHPDFYRRTTIKVYPAGADFTVNAETYLLPSDEKQASIGDSWREHVARREAIERALSECRSRAMDDDEDAEEVRREVLSVLDDSSWLSYRRWTES